MENLWKESEEIGAFKNTILMVICQTAAKLYHADQTEESETVKLLFRALCVITRITIFTENNVPITRRSSGCVERSGIPPSSVPTGQIYSQNAGTPQDTGIFPLIGINQLLSNA